MPQLYVPRLRDKLKLTADWSFTVYIELRNDALMGDYLGLRTWEDRARAAGVEKPTHGAHDKPLIKPCVIPAGTVLSVDRIFIRNGAADFNSMTFRAKLKGVAGKQVSVRFWAKLDDCNKIQFEDVTS